MIYLAIGVIIGLFVLMILLYIINRRTPLPEGCEDLKISTDKCLHCHNDACEMKNRAKGDDDL